MKRLRWTTRAQIDLQNIFRFLEDEVSPHVASMQCSYIFDELEQLQKFPELGMSASPLPCRKLQAKNTPYFVYYRLRGDVIEILSIRHASRKPLKRLPEI